MTKILKFRVYLRYLRLRLWKKQAIAGMKPCLLWRSHLVFLPFH